MTEPVTTSSVVSATLAGAAGATASGVFFGMPIQAVVLGAISSAAVLARDEPKSVFLVISYTIIGGLLGGALAPILAQFIIYQYGKAYDFVNYPDVSLLRVTLPVLVGLCWQFFVRLVNSIYPIFEKRLDDAITFFFSFLIKRGGK